MFVSASGKSERYPSNTGSVVKVAVQKHRCTLGDFMWLNEGLNTRMNEVTSGSCERLSQREKTTQLS